MSDAEREAQIRQELDAKDADGNSPAWKPNQYHASDIAFLLRLLDEARAERERILALLREPSEELVDFVADKIETPFADEAREFLTAIAAKIGGEG